MFLLRASTLSESMLPFSTDTFFFFISSPLHYFSRYVDFFLNLLLPSAECQIILSKLWTYICSYLCIISIVIIISCRVFLQGFLGDASVKNSPVSAGDARDTGWIPGLERSLAWMYHCLSNSPQNSEHLNSVHFFLHVCVSKTNKYKIRKGYLSQC